MIPPDGTRAPWPKRNDAARRPAARKRLRRLASASAGAALLVAASAAASAADSVETEVQARVLAGVRELFEGDWGEADRTFARLAEIAPDHPAGAYWPVATMRWRTALDPRDTRYDDAIEAALERTASLAEARLDANPDDPVALHYLGRAEIEIGSLLARRGGTCATGARGEAGRRHLERAREVRPDLADAALPLGRYLFEAAEETGLVSSLFSWLWFVPAGDAPRGMALIDEARRNGAVERLEADRTAARLLAGGSPDERGRAVEIAGDLHRRFPANAVLHVELLARYLAAGRWNEASIESVRIAERVHRGDAGFDAAVGTLAVLGRAEALVGMGETAEAERTLARFGAGEPHRPLGAYARVLLNRAKIRDLEGRRDEAVALYERVRDYEGPRRDEGAAAEAERWIDAPFSAPAKP